MQKPIRIIVPKIVIPTDEGHIIVTITIEHLPKDYYQQAEARQFDE